MEKIESHKQPCILRVFGKIRLGFWIEHKVYSKWNEWNIDLTLYTSLADSCLAQPSSCLCG